MDQDYAVDDSIKIIRTSVWDTTDGSEEACFNGLLGQDFLYLTLHIQMR
jgi:hypothetical protein